jgi:hypothetical protein
MASDSLPDVLTLAGAPRACTLGPVTSPNGSPASSGDAMDSSTGEDTEGEDEASAVGSDSDSDSDSGSEPGESDVSACSESERSV